MPRKHPFQINLNVVAGLLELSHGLRGEALTVAEAQALAVDLVEQSRRLHTKMAIAKLARSRGFPAEDSADPGMGTDTETDLGPVEAETEPGLSGQERAT